MSSSDLGTTRCRCEHPNEDNKELLHARVISQGKQVPGDHARSIVEEISPNPKQFIDIIETLGHTLITTDQELLLHHALDIATSPTPREVMDRYVKLVWSTRTKIEDPELDKSLLTAASNALSILNYGSICGIIDFQFCHYRDWSYCRIPNANLNMAVFAPGTSFDYADMQGVLLFRAHCHACSFRHTDLRGASTYVVSWLWSWGWSWTDDNLLPLAWSQDSTMIAYGRIGVRSGKITVASVEDASTPLAVIPLSRVSAAAFSPDGAVLATADDERMIRIWDIASQKCICEIDESRIRQGTHAFKVIPKLCYSSDGAWLAYCYETQVFLCDVHNGYICSRVLECGDFLPTALAFSPDNMYIAAASNRIGVWELSSAQLIAQFDCSQEGASKPATVHCTVAFSDDGKFIYYSDDPFSAQAQQWDLEARCRARVWTSTAKQVFMNMESSIGCKASFNDSSTGNEAESKLADAPPLDEPADLRACKLLFAEPTCTNREVWHRHRPCAPPRFSPNGDLVISERVVEPGTPCAIGMCCVWDAAAAEWCYKLKCNLHQLGNEIRSPDFVLSMAVSPDGSKLATAKPGDPVNLWDLHTGSHTARLGLGVQRECSRNYSVPYHRTLCFSPDGHYLLESCTVRAQLWDVCQRLAVADWEGLEESKFHERQRQGLFEPYLISRPVTAQFSPDGKYVVCHGGSANEFNIFETATQAPVKDCRVIKYHRPDPMRSVSSDRRFIISTRSDRNDCSFKIWDSLLNRFRCEIRGVNKITCMALSADDSTLAVANGYVRLVQIWRLNLRTLVDRDPSEDILENGDYNTEGVASIVRIIGIGQEGDYCADFAGAILEPRLYKSLSNFSSSTLLACRLARSYSSYVPHAVPISQTEYARMTIPPDTPIELEFY